MLLLIKFVSHERAYLASAGLVRSGRQYRSGVGYGRAFRVTHTAGGRGSQEYQDVVVRGRGREISAIARRRGIDPYRFGGEFGSLWRLPGPHWAGAQTPIFLRPARSERRARIGRPTIANWDGKNIPPN